MKYYLLLLFFVPNIFFAQTEETPFSVLTNSVGIPAPPSAQSLPVLEVISSIITPSNTIEDIKKEFPATPPYTGSTPLYPPDDSLGAWWRFYTQSSGIFNIPAVGEEILYIDKDSSAYWLQNIKTEETLKSSSKRKLYITYFDLFDNTLLVFHYTNQNPQDQEIRDKQGFFIRVSPSKEYMQMSTSPNFELEKSIYWRRFPNQTLITPSAQKDTKTVVNTNTNTAVTPENMDTQDGKEAEYIDTTDMEDAEYIDTTDTEYMEE